MFLQSLLYIFKKISWEILVRVIIDKIKFKIVYKIEEVISRFDKIKIISILVALLK